MDKQGALYFKLITGVFLLVLGSYALGRLWSREPSYELYSTRICEVGDGITVSGFVVRSETLLYCRETPTFLYEEGQWVGGGQAVAQTANGSLMVPQGGYLSYTTDGYEGLLTRDFILGCKREQLEALTPQAEAPFSVGRLIHGQTWYFAAAGAFPTFEQGSVVTLSSGEWDCEAKVLRTDDILVLECNSYGHRVASLRQGVVTLSSETLSGIPLPGEAIYYEAGQSCVYILRGAQAYRKTVSILRIQDDTVWVRPEDLPVGSQVILTEKEITDGMVLK